MLRLFRASEDQKKKLLAAAREAPPSSPQLLSLTDGSLGSPPKGFVRDFSRSEIGRGRHVFMVAREAFQRWEQFDLGWVLVANPTARIALGQMVAVEAHTACLWSINLSRIVEIVDSPARFGFMYATTALHVEEGQERFVIDFDPESGSVSYLIEAVSRPRHILARIGYPFSRAMQHRFARDSHARIRHCILGG
ncbi:MAG: DUF1990 domain-containing protein [Silvibacterium sp.]